MHWGFRVEVVADFCQEEGQRISSTMIRRHLTNGEVAAGGSPSGSTTTP
jgi:FAD synthase